jgi:hypothetical protein
VIAAAVVESAAGVTARLMPTTSTASIKLTLLLKVHLLLTDIWSLVTTRLP